MMFQGRFIATLGAIACALVLWGGAAQAVSVDLITNGDFESGTLAGWDAPSSSGGESFTINNGRVNPPGSLGRTRPISGSYDAWYTPQRAGIGSLTQYFTVPDHVESAIFSFTSQVGLYGFYDIPDQQFRVSLLDTTGDVITQIYSTAASGLQLGSTAVTSLTFDLTSYLQSNLGNALGVQFELEARQWSMNVSLDNVALMVETPAAVPLPPTIWMLLAALGLFGWLGWRKRRAGPQVSSFLPAA